MNKSVLAIFLLASLTGCMRGVSSGPSSAKEADDLQKWTDSVKAQKSTTKPAPLPTLSKIEIFSYKAQMNQVIDPNPASANMRSDIDNAGMASATASPGSSDSTIASRPADPASPNKPLSPAATASAAPSEKKYLRNPFAIPNFSSTGSNILRPDPARPRQPLEAFALDSLKMIGTIGASNKTGLVMTSDKVTYRVDIGQYIGQQNGKVVDVEPGKITLVELVPDGQGGWLERETFLVMD